MLLLFFTFCSRVLGKAPIGNGKNCKALTSTAPFSLVLFETSGCDDCAKLMAIFDRICSKYDGRLSVLAVDAGASQDIASKFSISEIPSIAAFAGDRLLDFYTGKWCEEEIVAFCEQILSWQVTKIRNYFEFFRFQNGMVPANLVLARGVGDDKANQIMRMFGGMLHVGLLENDEVAKVAGIDVAMVSRPNDGFVRLLSDVSESELAPLIRPHIVDVAGPDRFGKEKSPHTLVAVIDESDPLQRHDVGKVFAQLEQIYGENVSFQFCDFYKCPASAIQLGIRNYGSPVYVLSSKTDKDLKMRLFNRAEPTVDDFKDWMDEFVLGVKKEVPEGGIPVLYARNFMNIALNPKKDVILLLIAPGMQKHAEAQSNFKHLMDIFQPFPSIEFYEFNPKTEKVPGLRIPDTDEPIISIWPAHEQASGASLSATIPLKAIFETIMRSVKTRITPARIRDLNSQVNEISKE